MYEAIWTERAAQTYSKLKEAAEDAVKNKSTRKSSKAEGIFKQVHKCLTHLLNNPRHPGLQTHQYHSKVNPYDKSGKVFEAYVQNRTSSAYRLFWCYGPKKGQITILAITPHP